VLGQVDISWTAMVLAIATIFAALFARRLLPAERSDRGRLPIIFLLMSICLRALAVPIEMNDHSDLVTGLKLASAITLAAGMTGVVGKLVFDILVARLFAFPTILRDILLFIAFVITVMTILQQSGANLVSLVTTSAVLTAVIGLALQQPIGNMFAGLALQLDRTVVVGDWVKIENRVGRVEKISFRAITLTTHDGDSITIPNAHFTANAIENYTRPNNRHRVWCEVGFHYKHPPNEVKRIIRDALRNCPGVLADPPVQVVVRSFADSAVTYAVQYWITDFGRDSAIDSEVRTRIWYAAQRANLEIPYPIRTVHMHEITADGAQAQTEREHAARTASLSAIELFRDLEHADLELIARGMVPRTFASGERIVHQGDPGDSMFLIESGEVGIVLAVDNSERQVASLRAGDIFGELSLMTGEARAATCVALADVNVHEISHALFDGLLRAKPALAETFSAILSNRQQALEEQRGDLAASAPSHDKKQRLLKRIRAYFRMS
jgi:small-conductance mechanosensitive channel/CRP-like cAMP-binding protein